MTQEEKQLLLKDLCGRLPYGVYLSSPKGDGHLCGINQTIFGDELLINVVATKRDTFKLEGCKPYLRPISSMTEKEIEEFSVLGVGIHLFKGPLIPSYDTLDWLNKHMFDYRGLIPLGLALEAPEGMYDNGFEFEQPKPKNGWTKLGDSLKMDEDGNIAGGLKI